MNRKKNKFFIFFVVNIFLISIIFVLAIFVFNFLNKINLNDNEYVKGQIIINPDVKSPEILDRTLEIKLIAKTDKNLNWDFKPLKEIIEVKIGENNIVEYYGKNISKQTITSTANFLLTPKEVNAYLIKTECFCFIEQTLESGQSQIFTMIFYIDPSIDSDKKFDDLKELVFTYEFSEYKS